jgi:hypothetical protein
LLLRRLLPVRSLRVRLPRLRPVRSLRALRLDLRRGPADGIRGSSRGKATDAGADRASPGRDILSRRPKDESRPERAT